MKKARMVAFLPKIYLIYLFEILKWNHRNLKSETELSSLA